MNNKISFNINNGDKQIWEQSEHDNSVKLYTLVDDWTEENTISIPPGDMVMLANLYRTIKNNDIINSYINPNGSVKLATGDNLVKALERLIPKKPLDICTPVVTWGLCPECKGEISKLSGRPNRVFQSNAFCPDCGQALDWSGT